MMDPQNPQISSVKNDTNIDYVFKRIANDSLMNLQFSDVIYDVMDHGFQTSKSVLKGVSGEFRAGELSAIMGPSGCGKTTLLNLLSGYRIHKTSGLVNVNGRPQNMDTFRHTSRYILQDDHISPYFTIAETMTFASNFKLGAGYTKEQRQAVINEILDIFHLQKHADTTIAKLSGGERKRVCIALELMDNPAVLFLDEPTTGLDEFSASQCLKLLKRLTTSGRTVICSIHCPSARLFQMFDKVYILAEGQCIYQGAVNNILPYLEQFNLQCPITYNPADFIIETASYAYGNYHVDMVLEMNNGKVITWLPGSKQTQNGNLTSSAVNTFEMEMDLKSHRKNCSWWFEFTWIFLRITKQIWRDRNNMKLRIGVQLLVAAMTGWAYAGIGNNAKFAISNYYFLLVTALQFTFMCTMPMFAHIPHEMQYLRREYFNRWYRLSSYFMALLMSQMPVVTVMSVVCTMLMYFLTDQPLEVFRFLLFLGITLLTSMVATTYGLFIGSRFSLLNSLFLGPNILSILVVLSHLCMENPQPSVAEKILMKSSFLKHSMEGLLATLFKYDRPALACPSSEILCLLSKPRYLLQLLGSADVDYMRSVLSLLGFYVLFLVLAYANFGWRFSTSAFSIKNRLYRYFQSICLWKGSIRISNCCR